MTIMVRPATTEDLPTLRELFLQSRREIFNWQPPEAFRLEDFDAQTQGELLIVAAKGERLAGFISVWEPDHFIHHLYVDRLHFRRGIGRALLHALPGWPTTRYGLKCLRQNESALAFYQACCFTEVGMGTADDGEYLLLQSGHL
ncbi:GNAT family N-acetyltransferase [Dyella choica]|uniref:GNAT family N-acetyltransferase n=1 Tax=Dyella choica TaxID=1927959 RepID=A0A432M203_9GAMM|nr:GNAT family N-acetyltransferase [Dyella choica]RUL72166.1 GNAT family N-acetyltransferase [Dyella choica]